MPELPEVETVVRGLQKSVLGRKILSVWIGKSDFIDNPAEFTRLNGQKIASIERFGKFMLLRLANGERVAEKPLEDAANETASLLVHLGMTGQLAPSAAEIPFDKHTHVSFALDDGRELRYTDPRRFGRMAYLTADLLANEVAGAGADPLEVSAAEFAERVRSRNARIKALLLDQSVFRGVGNIYADESLWRAKIHPARVGSKISAKEAETLRRVLQEILNRAIVMRGSSISDFLDANGEPGEYQRHHRAYGREGKPCYRCRTPIRRVIVAGRSSYFCPKCQPAPRPQKSRRRKSKSRTTSR
ncbi:MAG: bifunctional DNA-formamidopyrimidine glycosylase/DNA-(apurinic or apyrimidinic site) lyase [Acidobacteria bacterium]|nr:bifunctional DNA-formamidopyrimidine glycosylase/DNA-(apurinic or apyrimidinic site) lyase [Acidobacteriota bacterium]